jgi:hypothetical protein
VNFRQSGSGGDVGDALRATSEQTAQELRENREAQTAAEKALTILRADKENAYQRALEALIPGTREWGLETLEDWAEEPEPEYEASVEGLTGWLEEEAIPYFGKREAELANRELIRERWVRRWRRKPSKVWLATRSIWIGSWSACWPC